MLSSVPAKADYVVFSKWLTLDRADRNTYLAGSMDGWFQLLSAVAPVAERHYHKCIQNSQTTPDMLRGAIEAFAKDKPKYDMASVQTVALGYLIEAWGPAPKK
jgi:hypothetical protein